jgi:hypothetical protein
MKITGYLDVFKDRNGDRELVYSHSNTIETVFYTALRNKLLNRDSTGRGASIDGMTWGSRASSGTFVDGTYAGTFSAGSNANCVFSTPTIQQIKCIGTFPFLSTKNINYFEIGQVYNGSVGVTQCLNVRYARQDSMYTSGNIISYDSGETMIISWTFQLGV